MPGRKGETTLFAQDEGIREDSNEAQLARLPTLLPQGVCTAGNSSQQNDASAACLVVSEDYLKQHDLQPMARLAGWSAVGVEPNRMGIGPVPATRRVLERTGVSLDRIDLIELNEAFATQALAVLKALEIDDFDRVNVNGSGISLGHPIGATGIRMLATLLHEMDRRKARYGLESMCIGGGMGMAALFERV